MEFLNSDFMNEMQLAGVFMCRLIKNMPDNTLDLLIYHQNSKITESADLLGLVQGNRLSSLKNAGIFLSADFWQNIEHRGVAASAFTADGFHFQLHVFEADDNYLLNVYRKAIEPLDTKSRSLPTEADTAREGMPFDMIGVATDVTESTLSGLTLSESEKRYRFLVNNLKEVIFQTDLQFNLLFLSPTWLKWIEVEVEAALHNNPLNYIHPEDVVLCRQKLDELVQRTIDYSLLEIRYLNKAEGYKWIEVFAKLTFDELKRPNGIIGTIYNISERKKMEMELKEREERFKAIFNSTFQFIALTDVEGNILEINKTALEARGVSYEELIGKPFWETTPGRSYKRVEQLKESFQLAAQGQTIQFEIEVLDRDQGLKAIDFAIRPIKDDQGTVIMLLPEGRDISETKRAQAAVIESEQRFRDIAENVDEVFWIRDLNSPRFQYINSTYERITGKTLQSLYENPMSFLDFVLKEDQQTIAELFQANAEEDTEMGFRVINKEGQLRWFMGRIFVIKDGRGVIRKRIGLARDVTPQKEKEQLLIEMLEKEKELNKMKSQFVSFVSHEFRTPLTTIQSSAELIEHYLFNNQADSGIVNATKIKHHIEVIHTKIAMITELLTDTLTLNQIEAGKITFDPKPLNPVECIQNMLSEFFSDRPDRRIVRMEITGTPVPVYLDGKLINRALINVLTNAFKFSNHDIELRLSFEKRQMKIEVLDRGIGIPEEDIPKLFSTFFRASNAGKVPGTGLGLQITKHLIDLHRGKIGLTSQLGRGTSVSIFIPLP
ncbi:PAS domain-containing sensor histidine kinase [Runella slithyformis]|uniref:histidine kinase n=1 Tax=Runella slithyformis (strain ATCC 29530 / DSM 19594 / LMG 11500 / NCIMB 11436 / LSU 4) TaxID=761193 RepID=A0A7U4E825_RUNSL|nr:PAS domain-containing sensor histidine kinase [Runella slithyformis]AEI50804.1 PAS/PAC sensor signal transduction histidine kinase [Runella slithyformis DSM 19594]